ncbi:hypothetical protein HELRODRAFT_167069 [Helobdella robusta]|uniref:Uncharacterized protein n=1 Tax=Helobdella robusta TaxID=6412 RepID=T1EYZ0_HELRO|nr:hypothetical protein HELRODRAFT_167069 [Helobdella robusta]ESO10567.1 hypothetical protein HELRODRAFT_167069 [Helobdella robusta]
MVWLLSFVASLAVMIYLLKISFDQYSMRPVTTKNGEKVDQKISFPDITLCNLDPFAEGEPKELSMKNYSLLIEEYENFALKKLDDFMVERNNFSAPKGKIRSIMEERWNANYYTCYVLKTKKLIISDSTIVRGLSVLLNVGPPNLIQVSYKSSLTNSRARGVQVSVHSPGTPPDLKRGFNVAPGTENIVDIVQTEKIRQDKANNKLCGTQEKITPYWYKIKYKRDLCEEYCLQSLIKRRCGCMTHQLNVPDKDFKNTRLCGNFSLNGSLNKSELEEEIVEKFYNLVCSFVHVYPQDEKDCHEKCLIACDEMSYDFYVASATWPQPSVQLDLFTKFIQNCTDTNPKIRSRYNSYLQYYKSCSSNSSSECTDDIPISNFTQIQESLLEIKFVMKQNFPYYQSENFTYTWEMMIGTVGGMLSLWLGVTVASAVEIIELVYLLGKLCWKNNRNLTHTTNVAVNCNLGVCEVSDKNGTDSNKSLSNSNSSEGY